ncbi:PAS domain-containing sensor histidine kinase [Microbacterium sp. cx-55]|uniref:sensor histidine kinase n=1 Tax=Microbacterium sp. cx-55 TaxID=2875948 RepID=UPI001CBD4A77|nr:ATP-binding protein [Microbacterium sp. cx-55]MBZ4487899.1 PAS domain-containing sensor histidine kinase [Microbacterium sp. cx-55]UGB34690.1 PAS domain-containing sensor histidine kinase [Microbacterium sp. cx-55]
MPLFELEASRSGRRRVFLRAQLPFLLGALFLALVTWFALPDDALSPLMVGGYVLAFAASVAALWVPWEQFARPWMMSVAVIDMAAVALIRAELLPDLPAVTMLAVFPIFWLAYGFPWYGIVVAVLGAVFMTSFGFFVGNTWPTTPIEWARLITLPVLIVGVAVVVYIAARHLRRNSARVRAAQHDQEIALRAAQDAEALALSILNTVSAGVAFYDADGRLDVANELAHRMVGMVGFRLDEPPYAGDNVLAADRRSEIPYADQIIPRALRGETIEDHVEWLGPPDAQVAIMASARRVYRDDGEVLGTVVVAYDVTELADAIEVREQFLRTVSHELRTPMTSITGFLDLIDEAVSPENERLHGYIQIVTRKTDDLVDRIGELLAANDDERPLARSDVDLVPAILRAVDDTRTAASRRGMTVALDAPATLAARVDLPRLTDAVTELLTNAVKFGDDGTAITVRVGRVDDRITVAVTNRGVGITHAEQRRIFDRFYRTASARSRAVQGFGLGLTNAREVVAAHGGHILIDSVPDAATTFTIDIPTG